MKTFLLPDLGEGLREAEIVSWQVAAGDQIAEGAPLLSVETDKAVVEIPAPRAGKIEKLFAKPGDIVPVGAPLMAFEGPAEESRSQGIVGEIRETRGEVPAVRRAEPGLRATPAVRALARRLGVDLAGVSPSGPQGTILSADVERAAQREPLPGLRRAEAASAAQAGSELVRGVRRAMAQRMAESHRAVAPATVIEDADIERWHGKGDPTLRLVRAVAAGCAAEPSLNVWFDAQSESRVLHQHIDLGIAVDTPDGLFVPVLRNITGRDDADLRRGIDAMRADILKRSIPPAELHGATITLSNFGSIAGRYAAPIVVPPQVAIVSAGRIRRQVVAAGEAPAIHAVMPISITFDHRAVSGGEAARFLAAVIAALEE
jgi:2-oxoisovalerate dehydrogenase E2 component (dihydrolipoyl transacylase)